jgi:hypothetical protein
MQEIALTYAQLERFLAELHGAEHVQATTFRGRLNHLYKLGVPRLGAPGKGVKLSYSLAQTAELIVCLQLEEYGLNPKRIIEIVEAERRNIVREFRIALQTHGALLLILQPRLMSERWSSAPAWQIQWSRDVGFFIDDEPDRYLVIDFAHALEALRPLIDGEG